MDSDTTAPRRRKQPFMRKVRTGCLTCKARKLKCDESQPHCKRCVSTGRTCGGYLRAMDRLQMWSPAQSPSPSRDVESSMPAWLASAAEKRSFHFFLTHAGKQLAGFSGGAFWSREVLQAALVQQSIRHLVVALGAAYERFDGSGDGNDDDGMTLAIQQCNSAIQHLNRLPGADSEAASTVSDLEKTSCVVTAAILFAMFAILQGHIPEAVQHVRSGLRVLQDLDSKTNGSPRSTSRASPGLLSTSTTAAFPIPIHRMRGLLTILYAQVRAMLNDEAKVSWSGPDPLVSPVTPASRYISLADAQADVEALFSNTLAFFQEHELHAAVSPQLQEALRPRQEELREALRASQRALEEFVARHDSETPSPGEGGSSESTDADFSSRSAIDVLRLYHVYLTVRLGIDARQEHRREDAFDAHESHFTTMLALARSVLDERGGSQSPSSNSKTGGRPACAAGLGLVMPLHMVAARCRNSRIRREAVALLKRCGRREGPWDATLAAKVLEIMIELEEGRGGVAVEGDARVREVKLHMQAEGKARFEFITVGQWKMGQEGECRDLSW